jgi:hypothetical protein
LKRLPEVNHHAVTPGSTNQDRGFRTAEGIVACEVNHASAAALTTVIIAAAPSHHQRDCVGARRSGINGYFRLDLDRNAEWQLGHAHRGA